MKIPSYQERPTGVWIVQKDGIWYAKVKIGRKSFKANHAELDFAMGEIRKQYNYWVSKTHSELEAVGKNLSVIQLEVAKQFMGE